MGSESQEVQPLPMHQPTPVQQPETPAQEPANPQQTLTVQQMPQRAPVRAPRPPRPDNVSRVTGAVILIDDRGTRHELDWSTVEVQVGDRVSQDRVRIVGSVAIKP